MNMAVRKPQTDYYYRQLITQLVLESYLNMVVQMLFVKVLNIWCSLTLGEFYLLINNLPKQESV